MREDDSLRAADDRTAIVQIEERPAGDRSSATAALVGQFHLAYRAAAVFEVGLRPISSTPAPGSAQEFDRQLGERGEDPGVIVTADPVRFCDDLGQSILRNAKRLSGDDYRRVDLMSWLRGCSDGGRAFGDEAAAGENLPILVIIGNVKPARLEDGHWVYAFSGSRGDGYVERCELDGEPCLAAVPALPRHGPEALTLRVGDVERRVAIPPDADDSPAALMVRDRDAWDFLIFPATEYQLFEVWSR